MYRKFYSKKPFFSNASTVTTACIQIVFEKAYAWLAKSQLGGITTNIFLSFICMAESPILGIVAVTVHEN